MRQACGIPEKSYGILRQNPAGSAVDDAVEQVQTLGYAVLDSGYNAADLRNISNEFDRIHRHYITTHGEDWLKSIDEHCTIRAPLTQGGSAFIKLVFNENLLQALKRLIAGKFILNQQNGIINPPQQTYNQSAWHRDLPYQHFLSTTPLAINALFCLDDFNVQNGATFVLPASHKSAAFPSGPFVKKNALQIEAKAGSFILLDCMLFHAGGFNRTQMPRRAVNHVYNIPYFKQQINLPVNMSSVDLSSEEAEILGFHYQEPASVESYLSGRDIRKEE
jgi:ectoine hydroxylase-related dioxygenase (phytanoyl-CoA dioxygenase family)